MKKADKIKAYNELNSGYHITNIKKVDREFIDRLGDYGVNDLYELYAKPSELKVEAWDWIHRTYEPKRVILVSGNSMAFSVWLEAKNGDVLHITKGNNYLVERV